MANGFSLGGEVTDPPASVPIHPAFGRREWNGRFGSRPQGGGRRCCGWGAGARTPVGMCGGGRGDLFQADPGGPAGRAVRAGVSAAGIDPEQVYALLHRVADEWDLLHRDLAMARADATRVKEALRQWQTRNARAMDNRWRGGQR